MTKANAKDRQFPCCLSDEFDANPGLAGRAWPGRKYDSLISTIDDLLNRRLVVTDNGAISP